MSIKVDEERETRLREEAWVGDAVLAMYVREWILAEHGRIDGDLFIDFTSNDFLRVAGRPTEVEAEIGRIYKEGGLEAGYAWIKAHLLPHFLHKQKVKARQRIPSKRKKRR